MIAEVKVKDITWNSVNHFEQQYNVLPELSHFSNTEARNIQP